MSDLIQKGKEGAAWDKLMELAQGLEPRIRLAFIKAVTDARLAIDVKELTAYLESGQIAAAEQAVAQALSYKGLLPALQSALLVAAKEELAHASSLLGVTMHMDAYSPTAVKYAQEFSGKLIVQINRDQLLGVQNLITQALKDGRGNDATARDLRMLVGLDNQRITWVQNYRAQLEAGDLNALNRVLRDARSDTKILRTFQGGEKLSTVDINRLVERYANRQLMARAQNIARTESIDALSTGRELAWVQAVNDGKVFDVYSRWFCAPDERTCPICSAVPGMNPDGVALGQPFQTPIGPAMGPTLHPSCRCVVFTRPR